MGQSHRKSFSLSIQLPLFSHFTSLHPHFFTLWGSRSESWSFEIERSRRFSCKSSFSVSNSRMQPLKPTATPVLWNLGKNIITLTCVISCINYLFQSQKLSYHYYSLSDVWCLLSDVRRLMSGLWCLMSEVWCLLSNVRRLMYDVLCLLSDVRRLTSGVWWLVSRVRRLMSEVCCLMSDTWCLSHVWCHTGDVRSLMYDLRRLMPDVSDDWCMHDVWCLVFIVWCQTLDIRHLTSDDRHHSSDTIHHISNIWYQTTIITHKTSNIIHQTSYIIHQIDQTSVV